MDNLETDIVCPICDTTGFNIPELKDHKLYKRNDAQRCNPDTGEFEPLYVCKYRAETVHGKTLKELVHG